MYCGTWSLVGSAFGDREGEEQIRKHLLGGLSCSSLFKGEDFSREWIEWGRCSDDVLTFYIPRKAMGLENHFYGLLMLNRPGVTGSVGASSGQRGSTCFLR